MKLIAVPAQNGGSTDAAAGGADGTYAKAFSPQPANGVAVTLPSDDVNGDNKVEAADPVLARNN